MVLGTARQKTVAGWSWFQERAGALLEGGLEVGVSSESKRFQFGEGAAQVRVRRCRLPAEFAGSAIEVRTSAVEGAHSS